MIVKMVIFRRLLSITVQPLMPLSGSTGPEGVRLIRGLRLPPPKNAKDPKSWPHQKTRQYHCAQAASSAFMTSGETATRSAAAVGFKKSNNFGTLLSGGEAAIGLHLVTGHHLVGISDEAIKRRPIPCQIGVLHGT
jgi:hypothetical protein